MEDARRTAVLQIKREEDVRVKTDDGSGEKSGLYGVLEAGDGEEGGDSDEDSDQQEESFHTEDVTIAVAVLRQAGKMADAEELEGK